MSTYLNRMGLLDALLHAMRQQPRKLVIHGMSRIGKSAALATAETGPLYPKSFHLGPLVPCSDSEPGEDSEAIATDPESLS
ncbi:hypothetical protein [Pseudoxanthomonas dokdonensis]|uniref:Uncharacterized protein n=1 Tax=Pseudoxanthomonas dokdonensis TaxID=344882 RepID=A0A0R0CM97_9GAMM|nr:hypothetical protein [Pseudoxanthomonas dokdonensis]KRG70534.1 hypothetical protein ABB29_05535 [Pseudoxanthomonas dokdonensis]